MRQRVAIIVEFPDTVPSEMLSEKRFAEALSEGFVCGWMRICFFQHTVDRREEGDGRQA